MSVSRDQAEAAGLNSISADQPVNPTPNPLLANPSFYAAPPLATDTVQRQSTSGTAIPPTTSAAVAPPTTSTPATVPSTSAAVTEHIAYDESRNPPLPVEALAPSPTKKVAGQRRTRRVKRRQAVRPVDDEETDDTGYRVDRESEEASVIIISEATAADAEKGNKPVSGPLSWQQEPCRSCHRPYNTSPPKEVWVAYGRDRQGRIIQYKYIRARASDGTSRRLRPEDAWTFDVSEARIAEDGTLVFGHAHVLDRRPTADELIQYVAGVKQGRRPVQAVWAHRLPTGQAPHLARKRAQTHERHEAEGDERPPKIPRYIPPGCRLVPFVSFSCLVSVNGDHLVDDFICSQRISRCTGSGTSSESHPKSARQSSR